MKEITKNAFNDLIKAFIVFSDAFKAEDAPQDPLESLRKAVLDTAPVVEVKPPKKTKGPKAVKKAPNLVLRVRKNYSPSKKREALNLAEGGNSLYKVATTIGIPYSTVYAWVQKDRANKGSNPINPTDPVSANTEQVSKTPQAFKKTRWSAEIRAEAEARIARHEPLDKISLELGVPFPTLYRWNNKVNA